MRQRMTFRTGAGLAVMAYAVMAGVLVMAVGSGLGEPIANYVPQVSWLTPETTAARVAALRGAGLFGTAGLYALVVAMSHALIAALFAAGFAWGVLNKGATTLGVDKAVTYATAIAGLYALATVTEFAMHSMAELSPPGGFSAVPGLWFATLVPSAAILARIGALIGHDAGSLIMTAIDAEPAELARLVETSEETRGAESLEASLARAMTRMPAARTQLAAFAGQLRKRTAP